MGAPATIRRAEGPEDMVRFAALITEYVESLPFVLDFQDLANELAHLEEYYGPPAGRAFLAVTPEGEAVGCVAVCAFEAPRIAELKRMYLQPAYRGRGLGRDLALTAMAAAEELGYATLRLDTVAELEEAGRLYARMGFDQIGPYRHNPLPTARFYEARLGGTTEAGGRADRAPTPSQQRPETPD